MERTKELLSNREMLDSVTNVVGAIDVGIMAMLKNNTQPPAADQPAKKASVIPPAPPLPMKVEAAPRAKRKSFGSMVSQAREQTSKTQVNSMHLILKKLESRFAYFDDTISRDVNEYD